MSGKKTVLGAAVAVAVVAGIAAAPLASAGGAASSGGGVAGSMAQQADSPGSGHTVAEWNRTLISTLAATNAQPASVHPTRSFAMVQAAEYNAVVSITRAGRPYRAAVPAAADARPDAAAEQAAHDVMVALYPSMRATFDSRLARQLAGLPAGSATRDGVAVGSAAARAVLAERRQDGSARPPVAFVAGTASGAYRPTPPKFAPPMFTSWGSVRPFLLTNADQLRPAAPPSVTSAGYIAALGEVKRIGQDSSATRTPDQTGAAKFWSAAAIWNTWNQIADQLIDDRHTTLAQASSVLARMDLAMADTTIALYHAKYHQPLWRPVTAIDLGIPAAHPPVAADPTWKPLTPTAADPSYPGAHSALSAAAAGVLTAFYSPALPVTVTTTATGAASRRFASLAAVAQEAGLSRIWAGQHTRLDHEAGQRLGRQVVAQVLAILPATLNTR